MDWMIIIAVLIGLVALYFIVDYFQKKQRERADKPPRMDTVNKTNYNIAHPQAEQYENLNPREAQEILDKWEKSDHLPSDEEYQAVKKAARS